MKQTFAAGLAALAVGVVLSAANAATLTGAGGTAIYPVLSKWADTYAKEKGDSVNYQAIGSGGGIKQIESKTVLFGNSDKPLQPDELNKNNLIQFPQVVISIVPVVNIDGVKSGELVFDGPTLASIYLGNIKNWDDPAIKKLNPNAKLTHQAIAVVYRSDGSGTTFNFTNYLSKVSAEWKQKVGDDTSVQFPTGVGGKGNAGVANYVQQVKGSIGYVEFAYAKENNLTYTDMVNKETKRVAPTMAAFQAAAANADFSKVENFYLVLTDQPGAASWPITAATYMLMRKDYDAAQNKQVLQFLDWCLRNGQDQAKALDYVPMPDNVIKQIEASWAKNLPG
ncbi:MAG TPA: phosphate ABC transporter substrate-binding protein PstS, partial [Alphaproteobacteria bacterium]|nr:phosphate ABC transporter substrate-binding protein PstS [Alphaproteobacteria bacterium]